jgi:superfamily II DNA or RNA helicase
MVEISTYIEERNIFIRNLCILHSDKKILILCKTKTHVETLFEMMKVAGIDVCIYYDNLKIYYDAHVLIATVSKAGRGYDDKQVSSAYDGRRFDVLIMPTTLRNTDQALGRALRGNWLLCYLMVDDNPTMKKHAMTMKTSSEKKGAKIVEEYI